MRAISLCLLLLVASCSTPGGRGELPPPTLPQRAGVDPTIAARAAGVAFEASGEGFVLQIYRQDRITLSWNAGAQSATFPLTEPRYPRWNGEIYETSNDAHRLRVEIRRLPCDGPDGQSRPARVRVQVDDQEMTGCGRDF